MKRKLSDFLTQVKRESNVQASNTYRQIGVRVWGKGSYERETITGKETKYKKLFQVRSGDLIINKIWTRNGAIAIVPEEQDGCFVSTEFPTFEIDRKKVDPDWLDLRLKTEAFWHKCALASGGTSGKNRIKIEKFLNIEIDVPDRDTQVEVAKMILKFEENFNLINLEIQELPLLAKTIVDSYVDNFFAETSANHFNDNSFVALLEKNRKKQLKLVSYEEGPFAIPSHWTWINLEDLCQFIDYRGKTPNKVEDGVPLITAKNVREGYFSLEPREYMEEHKYSEWMTRGFPEKNDILFTTEAPLGNICLYPFEDDEKIALAQRIITLHPYVNPDGIISRYIFHVLQSPRIRQLIVAKATGTTAKGIRSSRLKKIPIPIPSLEEQKQIVEKIDSLKNTVNDLVKEIDEASKKFNKLRKSALERAYG